MDHPPRTTFTLMTSPLFHPYRSRNHYTRYHFLESYWALIGLLWCFTLFLGLLLGSDWALMGLLMGSYWALIVLLLGSYWALMHVFSSLIYTAAALISLSRCVETSCTCACISSIYNPLDMLVLDPYAIVITFDRHHHKI